MKYLILAAPLALAACGDADTAIDTTPDETVESAEPIEAETTEYGRTPLSEDGDGDTLANDAN